MNKKLTKAQQEIYDFVDDNWFTARYLYRFKNPESQCFKITDKGFMEYRLIKVNEYSEWQFRKIIK